MLTHKNLVWNADISTDVYVNLKPGDKVLSILPISHVYEFTTGQILELMRGCEIVYLGKAPAPSVLLPALKEVRPRIVMTAFPAHGEGVPQLGPAGAQGQQELGKMA
jgi:long-chain acyl-CoA synthetase